MTEPAFSSHTTLTPIQSFPAPRRPSQLNTTFYLPTQFTTETDPISKGHSGFSVTSGTASESDYVAAPTTPTYTSLPAPNSLYTPDEYTPKKRRYYTHSRNTSCEGSHCTGISRNPSTKSMSSVATSFDSVQNVTYSNAYKAEIPIQNNSPSNAKQFSTSDLKAEKSPSAPSHVNTHSTTTRVTSRAHNSFVESVASPEDPPDVSQSRSAVLSGNENIPIDTTCSPVNHDFPFPQDPNNTVVEASNALLISKPSRPSKYTQHSQRRLSISSATSSISSHKLVTKTSASSLSGKPRNFSLYMPPPAPVTLPSTEPKRGPDSTNEPLNGIAVVSPTIPKAAEPHVVIDQSAIKRPSSPVIPTLPPPPQHKASASTSFSHRATSSQRSNTMIKATGISQHKHSMSITRRRSLPPQPITSSTERQDYYTEGVRKQRHIKHESNNEKRKVSIGKLVKEGDAQFPMGYYMLTGIRVSVSRCNAHVERSLTDQDFTQRHKVAFAEDGCELVPSSKYEFKFKDYSPWVFRDLRKLFKLDPADYLMSLTANYEFSEQLSQGKSGSYFYYSRDFRFIIKTVHHAEHKMLRKILKDYYAHVKNNPDTLISQFYGLHRVKLPNSGRKIHFVVMNNLFLPHQDVHRKYDLKGSSLGRFYKPPKEVLPDDEAPEPIYKDIDWVKKGEALKLGPKKSQLLTEQLRKDVALLKRLNIMDYSLLVGINDKKEGEAHSQPVRVYEPPKNDGTFAFHPGELRRQLTNPVVKNPATLPQATVPQRDLLFYNDDGGFSATDSSDMPLDEIYYLGVIDCLTPYTFYKRVETFWKSMSHARSAISAIPASEYGERFFEFMKHAIQSKNSASIESSSAGEDAPLLSGQVASVPCPSRPSVSSNQLSIVNERSGEISLAA